MCSRRRARPSTKTRWPSGFETRVAGPVQAAATSIRLSACVRRETNVRRGKLAERGGFEPPVPLPVHHLSKVTQSATLPPLRRRARSRARTAGARNCVLNRLANVRRAAFVSGWWRWERDSNPRSAFTDSGFQNRRNRPLCHPTVRAYEALAACTLAWAAARRHNTRGQSAATASNTSRATRIGAPVCTASAIASDGRQSTRRSAPAEVVPASRGISTRVA